MRAESAISSLWLKNSRWMPGRASQSLRCQMELRTSRLYWSVTTSNAAHCGGTKILMRKCILLGRRVNLRHLNKIIEEKTQTNCCKNIKRSAFRKIWAQCQCQRREHHEGHGSHPWSSIPGRHRDQEQCTWKLKWSSWNTSREKIWNKTSWSCD